MASRVMRVALASLLVVCAAGADDDARIELQVYLVFDAGLLGRALMGPIRSEVEAIYAVAHARIVWLDEPPRTEAKSHEARAYILWELPSSIRRLLPVSAGRETLAVTLGANIYISWRAVMERASARRSVAMKHMARAIARTLAHELAHRFLGSGHTAEGILKPVLTSQDLIARAPDAMSFGVDQIQRLESRALRYDARIE